MSSSQLRQQCVYQSLIRRKLVNNLAHPDTLYEVDLSLMPFRLHLQMIKSSIKQKLFEHT